MALPMRRVTTQVSDMKSSTAYVTAFKKKLDTHGAAPSLLRIFVIAFHTYLARDKFLTTAGKLLSAFKITCPRYLTEVTIYRGSP